MNQVNRIGTAVVMVVVAAFGITFCTGSSESRPATDQVPPGTDRLPELEDGQKQAIKAVLDRQVEGWNAGQIGQFMEGYWKSKSLTFASGGSLTRGWQQTHDRYVDRYSPPDQMGHLWFDNLEFQAVAKDAALVLGQWHLKDQLGDVAEGNFSLVMKKFSNGWKVIHDHTSLRESKPTAEAEDRK